MTNAYTRAYTEVLEILSHFSKEEYAKIPTKKIEFYRSNMDKKYNYKMLIKYFYCRYLNIDYSVERLLCIRLFLNPI